MRGVLRKSSVASEYGVQGNRVPACADATVPSGTPRCLREHEEFLGCIERRGRGHDMRMGEAPLIGGSCPAVERDAVLPTGRRANGSSSDRSLPLLGHPDSTGERSPGLSASARALQFAHPLSCLRPHQGTSGQRGACCARGQEEALREESNKPPRAPEAPSPPHPISHSHSLSDAVWFETLRHLEPRTVCQHPRKRNSKNTWLRRARRHRSHDFLSRGKDRCGPCHGPENRGTPWLPRGVTRRKGLRS